MNNGQRVILEALASGIIYHDQETMRAVLPEFQALAQVVLALEERTRVLVQPRDEEIYPSKPSPDRLESSGPTLPVRTQMRAALLERVGRDFTVDAILDELFDILEQDPGHDVTANVVGATRDRSFAVDVFQEMIKAIRRGE